jgi:hypothetical protein
MWWGRYYFLLGLVLLGVIGFDRDTAGSLSLNRTVIVGINLASVKRMASDC